MAMPKSTAVISVLAALLLGWTVLLMGERDSPSGLLRRRSLLSFRSAVDPKTIESKEEGLSNTGILGELVKQHGTGSGGHNIAMAVEPVYHPLEEKSPNADLVTMSCAANGKYPFLMHEGGIVRWVCHERGERAVTAVMVKIFEDNCVAPPSNTNLMLDVGSNHGYYGLLALKMGCEALLFDLQPECHQMINNAIVKNEFTERGRLVPRGVSDSDGQIMVSSEGCEGRFPAQAFEEGNFDEGDTPVLLNPLTHFIPSDQPILMMKVDTEGNEKRVIDGSMPFFERRLIKNAIVELTPGLGFWKYAGFTAEEVASTVASLSNFGYTMVPLSDFSILSTSHDVFNYIMTTEQEQFDMWITTSTVSAEDVAAIKRKISRPKSH